MRAVGTRKKPLWLSSWPSPIHVKKEAKPFDHPQLFILVDGTAPMLDPANPEGFFSAHNAQFQELPATGAAGRCRP